VKQFAKQTDHAGAIAIAVTTSTI